MQGNISSWLEIVDSTQLKDILDAVEALQKIVVRDGDFECLNLTFNKDKKRILRYEAIYWDNHPPDYPKLLRRLSRRLWPEEWILFEEKRSMTFCYDCSTLRVILVSKETVHTLNGEKLGEALRRRVAAAGDVEAVAV